MAAEEQKTGFSFGTFSGVFTPSILTIFGLIMFMRTSFVIGTSGILMALVILLIAEAITFATGLSISAVSTNTPVKGGGAYFLISRALGPSFGSAIGVSLFFAQTLSVPFYILGFTEAVATNFPVLKPYYLLIALTPGVLLFIMAWIGTDWAIKAQYFILAILGLSILAFLGGALFKPFSFSVFSENLKPSPDFKFFHIFAIFFPAVTGIMAGVNMSGDLKDPQRSIPKGTLLAIVTGGVVYALQMIITGGAFTRQELINNPFEVLEENALFGVGLLVFAGVVAATISSALGSMLGAPRILQALAKDKIIKAFNPFAVGSGANNEPRRAMLLTFIITMIILFWGGVNASRPKSEGGIDPLNAVAAIVSMFFLYTYAMVNLAAFVESFGANPSFRPRFKYFHWIIALFGASACILASFMIDAVAALAALLVMTVLFLISRKTSMERTFGDARRGFIFSRIRDNLLNLAEMPSDPKNWRPTITVLSGNPTERTALVEYASLFGDQRGILSIVKIIPEKPEDFRKTRKEELKALEEYAGQNRLNYFPEVIIEENLDVAVRVFLQSHSIGPIKPNIIMTGWPNDPARVRPFMHTLNMIPELDKNLLTMVNSRNARVPVKPEGTIDIWWRGMSNGSLMVIMAYLLVQNNEWKNMKIRLLRLAPKKMRSQELEEMNKLAEAARIDCEVKVVTSDRTFEEVFRYMSEKSQVIFIGTRLPKPDQYEAFYEDINSRLDDMPVTFLVASNGEADLMV